MWRYFVSKRGANTTNSFQRGFKDIQLLKDDRFIFNFMVTFE